MTDKLRPDAQPERDHLTPADILSDDPDKSVDPSAIRTRIGSRIGPGTCAELRRHYRGRCAHDTDAAPVRWDAVAREWVVCDDTAADSDTED